MYPNIAIQIKHSKFTKKSPVLFLEYVDTFLVSAPYNKSLYKKIPHFCGIKSIKKLLVHDKKLKLSKKTSYKTCIKC